MAAEQENLRGLSLSAWASAAWLRMGHFSFSTDDAAFRRLRGLPGFRIALMIPTSVLAPAGVLLLAWAAKGKAHTFG
ncbi:hypothetical protein B0H67DRAFT_567071 [Lasiosphaeris hirsuta]|uniref:Uncharacterized protein n=1 Tax=Lasiosphaeris hirsuta TaxID=260670 RepID=A0AA40BDL2_9PEZI|nr:hypothetical protein B0H67DRAFT_567071 [Lasiosphaeris hirsuta]